MAIDLQIPFRPGDPKDFESYQGQEALKRRIGLRINAMKRGENFKALFTAPAGQGKTALVRIVAEEMAAAGLADHYIETIAGRFETKADLDTFLRRVKPYTIIFIDEIHGLTGSVRDALYPAIQDNLYAFNDKQGASVLPPGLHWMGATTELGKVHAALQRRLLPFPLEPLSVQDRAWLALTLPRAVDVDAAFEMASRCWSPWEVKDELYITAGDVASEKESWRISLDHVLEACGILGIDKHGLRPKERKVLECLLNNQKIVRGNMVYAMAKAPLIVMAGVDEPTFTQAIEPKLLKMGYIAVTTGVGRSLTDKALKEVFNVE